MQRSHSPIACIFAIAVLFTHKANAHDCPSGQHHSYKLFYVQYSPGGRGTLFSTCAVDDIKFSVAAINACYKSSFTFGLTIEPYNYYQHSAVQDSPVIWGNSTNSHVRYIEYLKRNDGVTVDQATAGYIRVEHKCSTTFYYLEEPGPDEDLGSDCESPEAGNPVAISNGNKIQLEQDYSATSERSGLAFSRAYNNQDLTKRSLGQSWRHSYSRSIVPRYASTPSPGAADHRSKPFYTAADACTKGWPQIRSRVSGLQQATATYQSGACVLSLGGTQVSTISVRSTNSSQASWSNPAIQGYYAVDDNGRREYFPLTAGQPVASPGISSKLELAGGGFTRVDSAGVVETYSSGGKLLGVAERGQPAMTMSYDGSGRLDGIHDAFGRSLTLSYDAQNRLSNVVDPQGQPITYTYNTAGRLSSATYPGGGTRNYLYENSALPNALTGIVDENSDRFATWSYDSQNRVLTSQHAGGAELTTFVYNSDGTRTVTDAAGAARTYSFQTIGGHKRLTSVTGPACQQCGTAASTTYDVKGNVSSRTDFNQTVTTYGYDLIRNLETSRTEAYGTPNARTVTTAWHATHRVPTVITEPGRQTTHAYDASTGRLLSTTVKDLTTNEERVTSYTYDAGTGLIAQIDGPRTDVADVTTYSYYQCTTGAECGRLHTVENALGHTTTITSYDGSGRPLSVTHPTGAVTSLTWSPRGWLTSQTHAGETTSFDHDDAGQLIKVTLPSGAFLEYEYDSAHRLTGVEDEAGNRIVYTLDAAGNRIEEKVHDPNGTLKRSQGAAFNTLNLLEELQGADGQLIELDYDAQGNNTAETVAGSFTTTRSYDAFDRLISETDAEAGVTAYGYNSLDQLTTVTDPRNLVTTYGANAFGDVVELQSPDTGTTTSTYDSAGNIATRTDAKGQTTAYSYDALNRLAEIEYAGGSIVTYTYDQGQHGKGRLTGITDTSGSTSWIYNVQGRVESKTQNVGSLALTTSYTYDSAGRMSSQTLPSGRIVGINWAGNKIAGVTIDGNALASNVAYEPFGPMSRWDFANGQQVARSFDLSGRMTGHSLGSIGYDTADRITVLNQSELSLLAASKTYGYDALHRLTSYSDAATSIGYGYDGNGNRSLMTGSGGTTTSTLDNASNRLLSLSGPGGMQSFGYDANGSTLSDGSNSYTYNTAGRMASANGVTYAYNGLNQRTLKSASGVYTIFAYDDSGHLLGEYGGSGNPIQETVWLGNLPLAVLKPGSTYYVHADHLNTPRQIEDQAGSTVWLWNTGAFGDNAPDEDPLSTGIPFTYNLRHAGQYFDEESGLMQNWYRDYDAALGRYVESDPIGLVGGVNTYEYAGGNPLSLVDPMGLQFCIPYIGCFGPQNDPQLGKHPPPVDKEFLKQVIEDANKGADKGEMDFGMPPVCLDGSKCDAVAGALLQMCGINFSCKVAAYEYGTHCGGLPGRACSVEEKKEAERCPVKPGNDE